MEDITGKITLRAPLFCHEHCQGKLVNKKSYVKEFYEMLGFTVKMSTAECCGMAGSFGYKKQYYELSKSIGKELTRQIDNGMIILASGTSCREQIADELKRKIYHPAEYLEQLLK
jgi:Fe-S oxidoreductase